MTPDLLYRTEDVADAAAAAVNDAIPARVTVVADLLDPNTPAPYVLLTLSSPRWAGPPMSGDQQCTVTLHALAVGADLGEARKTLDLARQALIGRQRDGSFTVPITLEGRQVMNRRSNNDSTQDTVTGIPQATESFTLILQRAGT